MEVSLPCQSWLQLLASRHLHTSTSQGHSFPKSFQVWINSRLSLDSSIISYQSQLPWCGKIIVCMHTFLPTLYPFFILSPVSSLPLLILHSFFCYLPPSFPPFLPVCLPVCMQYLGLNLKSCLCQASPLLFTYIPAYLLYFETSYNY